jgi:hypothetical protein
VSRHNGRNVQDGVAERGHLPQYFVLVVTEFTQLKVRRLENVGVGGTDKGEQ